MLCHFLGLYPYYGHKILSWVGFRLGVWGLEFGFGVWDLGLWALGFRIASYMVNKEDYLALCPLSQIQKMKPSQFGIYFNMNLHVRWGLAKLLKHEKNCIYFPGRFASS